MKEKKICCKCHEKKAMKNFDVCFDCYIGKTKTLEQLAIEERALRHDLLD